MIRLRPYKEKDTKTILSWCKDEKSFYRWTAGILGEYPLTVEQFQKVNDLISFTAVDDNEIIGFFTLRQPSDSFDIWRRQGIVRCIRGDTGSPCKGRKTVPV